MPFQTQFSFTLSNKELTINNQFTLINIKKTTLINSRQFAFSPSFILLNIKTVNKS